MKNFLFKGVLVFLLLWGYTITGALAQVITAGPDSTLIRTATDPLPPEQKGLSTPGKAALYSAILPGLGQVYNKSYWKVPLIYAAAAGLGYSIAFNHSNYLKFRQAVVVRRDTISTNNVDEYTPRLVNFTNVQAINSLSRARDANRRRRDYSILYSILAYGLNITEAYVHAHLKGFDVGDDLSLQVSPTFLQVAQNNYSPAFSLTINLKK